VKRGLSPWYDWSGEYFVWWTEKKPYVRVKLTRFNKTIGLFRTHPKARFIYEFR